jgi:hypothetical protein
MELNPLYRLYVSLNEKVDNLIATGGVSSSNGTDLSDIIVRLRALEARSTFETEISAIMSKIGMLEKENEEMKIRLEGLNKLNDLETRIYNLEAEPKVNLEPLERRISVLEGKDYGERLVDLEGKIGTMEQIVNVITDMTARVGELERKPDLVQRLSAMEGMISNLNLSQ